MAKKVTGFVKLQIAAGKATPAPPVGPALGQAQINIMEFCKQFNARTNQKEMEGLIIPVVVSGEVQKPGKIVFERPAIMLEAIMEAGGFTADADPQKVSLIRQVQGDHHTQIVDLSPVLKGMPTPVMYVSPGDVIYVRPKFISF